MKFFSIILTPLLVFSLSVTYISATTRNAVRVNDISDSSRKQHSKTIQRELRKKKKNNKSNKSNKKKKAPKSLKSLKSPKSSKSSKSSNLCEGTSQEDALLALKAGVTNDPKNFLSNWVAGGSVCTGNTANWKGITCVNDQVTELKIVNKDVNGTVSPLIGCLSNLTNLDLGLNLFRGEIPTTLGNLKQLNTLRLDENDFSGTIPETLGDLLSLEYLIMYANNFSGNVPAALGNLVNLIYLDLDFNNLSGMIPSSLGNLLKLRELYVGENNFIGSMPDEICDLKNGKGVLTELWTDCTIECKCCTACYSFDSLLLYFNTTVESSTKMITYNMASSFNTTENFNAISTLKGSIRNATE